MIVEEEAEQSMLVMWVGSLDWRETHSGSRSWLCSLEGLVRFLIADWILERAHTRLAGGREAWVSILDS